MRICLGEGEGRGAAVGADPRPLFYEAVTTN